MIVRVNLLDFSPEQLVAYCDELGEKPYRAKQLQRWMHVFGVDEFDAMTDLAKSLREKLSLRASVNPLKVISDFISVDGTRKWLLDVGDGNAVETVFIPEDDRGTLCVSTQVGCTVNCRFCSTGKQGFSRNLTTGEIIGQLRMAEFALRKTKKIEFGTKGERQISNVVLMGMGEPLLNYDATLGALKLMLDDNAYGLSRRRVTVSTSGIIPMMDKLAQDCPVALAVSLHAPNDELRNKLVPMNRKYGLSELMNACSRYLEHAPRESIMFEYCMLDGVNDTDKHARELITLVTNKFKVSCKFNLIPFNPYPESGLKRSSDERVRAFGKILLNAGFVTTVRKSRGEDVDAACGQLAGEVKDRTRLRERMLNFADKNFHSICAFTEEYV